MRQVRIVLILTENWTMRPTPDVPDLVTFALEAERAGLDAVMVSEHIVLGPSADEAGLPVNPRDYALPGNQDPATPWPSPLVLLSAIAAATSRIRLVAGALISPLRHPLASAKDLATLDRLSGGRLIVQPTVSWHRDEYAALGVPFGQRGEILDEQLEIWAKAWRGSPVSHDGKHYSFGRIWVEPPPARRGGPVLWFGGSSLHPRLIARLVRYGSGFNPLGPADDEGLARLAAALTAAGRGPGELEFGGTGIGAAVARQLTAAGDQVAILGRRAGLLASVAAATGAADVVCDVSDAEQVSAAVASVVDRFGRLDGLVLNAGVMVPGGVCDLSVADWDTLVAVNLTGAFLVARAALPHLLAARGAVVSVASVAALRASAEMGGYAVTKAGLVMLTQSLAVDHAHQGLRANVVCPGWTVTEMADEEMASFGAPRGLGVAEAYELVTSLVPQRRAARASEVAAVVAWLLSGAASYVNGAVIPVDGAGIAVDAGTLPFDPRVDVRRDADAAL